MENTVKNWRDRKKKQTDLPIEQILGEIMQSQTDFLRLFPHLSRGKSYKNRGAELPEGNYEELNVTDSREDSRRIIVDMNNSEVFVSRCHYQPGSFWYAGRIGE